MPNRHRPTGADYVVPGMAYKRAFGSVNVPMVVTGRTEDGTPTYQAGEVSVRPATPGQALHELDAQELRDDVSSTRDWIIDALKNMGGGGLASRVAGRTALAGIVGEKPTVFSAVKAAHELLGRYLDNEDLGRHAVLASRDLMPNLYNPSDDNPQTQSNGVYVDPGPGGPRYFAPPQPPTYLDRGGED